MKRWTVESTPWGAEHDLKIVDDRRRVVAIINESHPYHMQLGELIALTPIFSRLADVCTCEHGTAEALKCEIRERLQPKGETP